MKTLVYLLFTSTMATSGGSVAPAISSTTTVVPTKAACMQGVADFIGQSNFKLMGNEGQSRIEVGGFKIVKTATCSISEGEE